MRTPPPFTCPDCGRTSYSPMDRMHNFCGACKRFFNPDDLVFKPESLINPPKLPWDARLMQWFLKHDLVVLILCHFMPLFWFAYQLVDAQPLPRRLAKAVALAGLVLSHVNLMRRK